MHTTAAPEPLRDGEVVEHFVHQYESPLGCVRELVQNSLDAGSEEIDIRVDFEPEDTGGADEALVDADEPARGFAELVVEDRGGGMGRGVIEGRLVTLFDSVGDEEPNRVGRYGVGLVSVFALEPELVIIDSSWRGENWRVVFDRDRRYTLRRRAGAIYGTVVRVIMRATADQADALRERARAATRDWCRHVAAVVRFDGERISGPLAIDAPCSVTVRDEGDAIVVAHPARGEAGSYGLYRAGLTLAWGDDERAPGIRGIAYKISSSRLDLTLTRDAVIHDVHYQRLIAQVRSVVETRLCERVFSMLERRVWTSVPEDEAARAAHEALGEYLYDAAIWHIRRGYRLPPGVEDRAAFRSPAGLAIGVSAVRRALARRGVVFFEAERSPLTDALEDRGHLVIRMTPGSPEHRLLKALDTGGRAVAVCERCCMPLPLAEDAVERWR
ncbi:MAG: ATP-binding protein, partial [Myxococcales bacterium]|nr:ATP-binding protein [Myxococcales bacterium]